MSEGDLGRIKEDLAVMRRAMGLHLSFGREMLVFGLLLTVVAVGAAVVSLWRKTTGSHWPRSLRSWSSAR